MIHVGYKIGVDAYWSQGFTGTGVDVALIDTGVAPVEGLNAAGKALNGPDPSFESQSSAFRYLDTNGHGTHLAGIIAGRDAAAPSNVSILDSGNNFLGIAPELASSTSRWAPTTVRSTFRR
jgi:serine protease AprX